MRDTLVDSLKESTQPVLSICVIVLVFSFILPLTTVALFLTDAMFLIIGLSIFTLGSDMVMISMGEAIGLELARFKKIGWIAGDGPLIDVAVTVVGPDLQVLTGQMPAVPGDVLVGTVALGAGLFLVLVLSCTVLQINLTRMFIISYALVSLVAGIFSPDLLAVALSSGGVTASPTTIPFIPALGTGVSTVFSRRNSEEDSSGLCVLCSIGPILTVLIMGIFYDSSSSGLAFESPAELGSLSQVPLLYAVQFVAPLTEVVEALLPIMTIFILLQILRLHLSRTKLTKVFVSIIYTILGLPISLTGVSVDFMPVGHFLGGYIARFSHNWVLIPLSAVLGFFIVVTEPTVHVLNKQVENTTSGAISQRVIQIGLSVGASLVVRLSTIQIMHQIDIWYFLLPGCAIALLQTRFTPKVFTAIAFDPGGVTVGTIATVFLLLFGAGICETLGGNIMTDASGTIAMIATLPPTTIQEVGILFQYKSRQAAALKPQVIDDASDALAINIDLDGGETEPQLDETATNLSEETISDTQESALPGQNETAAERPEPEAVREHDPLPEEDTV